MTFADTIREAVLARKGDWPQICADTNISYWWLTKFAQGRIENPGVRHLETLRTHFETHPIPKPELAPAEVAHE